MGHGVVLDDAVSVGQEVDADIVAADDTVLDGAMLNNLEVDAVLQGCGGAGDEAVVDGEVDGGLRNGDAGGVARDVQAGYEAGLLSAGAGPALRGEVLVGGDDDRGCSF